MKNININIDSNINNDSNKGEMKMKKFLVEIKEELIKTLEIDANTEEEAVDKVTEMYRQEEIVLDESDFDNVHYYVQELDED